MRETGQPTPPPLDAARRRAARRPAPEEADEAMEIGDADIIPDVPDELMEIAIDLEDLDDETPADAREGGPESREQERKERQALLEALGEKGLQAGAALEIVAAYDRKAFDDEFGNDFDAVVEGYGMDPWRITPEARKKLEVIFLGMRKGVREGNKEEIAATLEQALHKELVDGAFQNVDALRTMLERESKDPEAVKDRVRDVMRSMHALSKQLPVEKDENKALWGQIYDRYKGLVHMKRTSGTTEMNAAFSEVFREFSDFIEDDIVAYRMRQEGGSIEHVTHEVYGRTRQEVEKLKQENRANVSAEIKRLVAEQHGFSLKDLERLHEINNRGIVPKDVSKIRDNPDMVGFYGKQRLSTLGDDVKPEMEALVERANDLIDKDTVDDMTKFRYEVNAAELHNDLLEIHPFGDRNGSTAVLFLELLMARKGYEPPTERNADYYDNLRKVLGHNPLAIGIVGYEHYKTAYKPGFYEGETMTPEKRKKYEKVMEFVKRAKARKK